MWIHPSSAPKGIWARMGIVQTLQEPVDGEGPPRARGGCRSDKYTENKCSRLGVGVVYLDLMPWGLRSLEVCEAGAGLPVLG